MTDRGTFEIINFEDIPAPVCDTCGGTIEERGQACPALDGGECAP